MTSRIIEPQSRAVESGAKALLSAAAVRNTAYRLLSLARAGLLDDWTVHLDRLDAAADFVAKVVRERYPSLDPPFHARWRHFVFGGRDLWREIASAARARGDRGSRGARVDMGSQGASADRASQAPSAAAEARAAFDLAITSVLLDAGAGPGWQYRDEATGLVAARSEGLALASLRWFARGGLSNDPGDPLRADATALRRINTQLVSDAFQSSDTNPLVGAEGRAALLNRLGAAVEARPDLFATADSPRPGGLFDVLARQAVGRPLPATAILDVVLEGLGPIWPDRPQLGGVSLGDCWPYPPLEGSAPLDQFVPLHKLSQWLSYSLIEPLEDAGVRVCDVGGLTGLAEYRNGGLFVDLGVLVPRDAAAYSKTHLVSDPFVVGWRSLTVALLDEIVPRVAGRLGLTSDEFPLARVLEGGTWAAGRRIAREKRSDGGPPFHILSDGTVF